MLLDRFVYFAVVVVLVVFSGAIAYNAHHHPRVDPAVGQLLAHEIGQYGVRQ